MHSYSCSNHLLWSLVADPDPPEAGQVDKVDVLTKRTEEVFKGFLQGLRKGKIQIVNKVIDTFNGKKAIIQIRGHSYSYCCGDGKYYVVIQIVETKKNKKNNC